MKRFKCTNVVLDDYVICITLLCKSCPELRSHSDCLTIGTISPFNTKKQNMENITDPTSLNDDDDDNKTNLPNTTNPTNPTPR